MTQSDIISSRYNRVDCLKAAIKLFYAGGNYEEVINHETGKTKKYHYIHGGSGLAAVFITKEDSAETDNLYYVHKDYLGSIHALTNQEGTAVERYSFDAWGHRRNPTNWSKWQDDSTNYIVNRGFTGHVCEASIFQGEAAGKYQAELIPLSKISGKHMDIFGLINMNGRVYDPDLGRFISPDPYVQMPDNSQNFNRYSYALNNPLKYTDPDGEWIHLAIGAFIGGTTNLMMNSDNIDNFWEGLGYFGVGAAAGALSAGVGTGISVSMAGGSFGAGFMGTAAGVSSTGFFAGAATGASAGLTNGFITGIGNTALGGGNLEESLSGGLNSAWKQGIAGGITGGIFGGLDALSKDVNFFTGKASFDISEGYGAFNIDSKIENIKAKYVGEFEGVNMFESKTLGTGYGSGGITLPGEGIFVGKGTFSRGLDMGLVRHEFGHILQAKTVGKASYYTLIGKESLASASLHGIKGHSHDLFWTETWANHLSYEYFGKPSYWNMARFPTKDISTFNKIRLLIGNPFIKF